MTTYLYNITRFITTIKHSSLAKVKKKKKKIAHSGGTLAVSLIVFPVNFACGEIREKDVQFACYSLMLKLYNQKSLGYDIDQEKVEKKFELKS